MKKMLILITLFFVSVSVLQAQEVTPDPLSEAQEIVSQAQAETQQMLDIINTLFGGIQVFGVVVAIAGGLVTLAGGLLTIVGFRNVYVFRKELSSIRELKEKLEEGQKKLDQKLGETQKLPALIEEQMNKSTEQMYALALVQFANLQIDLGNRSAALKTLERALERDNQNHVTQFFYGEVNVRLGHYEKGIEYLTKAQSEDMPDARATLAYAYRMLGDQDEARRDQYYSKSESIYTELEQQYPDLLDITGESVYGGLAGLYRKRNMIDKAIAAYERIAGVTPGSSYPINNLGLLHFEFDGQFNADCEKGREYFERSRRKAKYALQAETADYWRLFDLITAEVALENVEWDELRGWIDEALEYRPIPDDIEKLHSGLLQLKRANQPPKLVQHALNYLDEYA